MPLPDPAVTAFEAEPVLIVFTFKPTIPSDEGFFSSSSMGPARSSIAGDEPATLQVEQMQKRINRIRIKIRRFLTTILHLLGYQVSVKYVWLITKILPSG